MSEGKVQKFQRGEGVRIADDLGPSMSHFRAACDAVVLGSYADKYGGDTRDSYTLMFRDGSSCSWYYERQLSFLEHLGEAEIDRLTREREARDAIVSDLKWIVDNWEPPGDKLPGAALEKLMAMIGIDKPWGSNGEGVNYYANANFTLAILDPVLRLRDVARLEEFCERLKRVVIR
jgi:hypothetical protein